MIPLLRRRIVLVGWFLALVGDSSSATTTELVGVFGNKAVLVIDGRAPLTLAVGERTAGGVRLVEVGSGAAVVDVDGRRQRLALGVGPLKLEKSAGEEEGRDGGVTLVADSSGHHIASGSVNGAMVRFIVDTGATMVSIGRSDAARAGIDYRRGKLAMTETANGPVRVWLVRLDTVRVGSIVANGVEGLVHEGELPYVLLGMSFLKRMDIQREGDRLVLRKRF
ncbi:TIGR02281 family clan AA aspartic protease [Azoarcus sp. KH32C]|uniref:retropepsin-like aspartic protease family protein n=1 Tax=Azoarcus sp. KH32C TaxID=748247 RepID=UPI0005A1C91A|nr:TIGR02281 family clan AA aspartic protease [Azoarcus sp. KH32C]